MSPENLSKGPTVVNTAPHVSFNLSASRDTMPLSADAVEDVRPRRGTALTGFAQIFTAVVGSGILALPSAMAALGWIAGILLLGAHKLADKHFRLFFGIQHGEK